MNFRHHSIFSRKRGLDILIPLLPCNAQKFVEILSTLENGRSHLAGLSINTILCNLRGKVQPSLSKGTISEERIGIVLRLCFIS